MKELAVIIPVYNEESNIKKVIKDWLKILDRKIFDIILINDGSKDKTKEIICLLKKKNLNLILINKRNSGHGETIYTGYKYALKKKYRYVFQVDSDDQFSHKDFNKFWKLRNKNYDLIIGNRYMRKDPWIRIFLSKYILRNLFIIFFQRKILDANIPYRLMKSQFLDKFTKKCPPRCLAPNILMSLYSKNTYSLNVKHYKRSKGELSWSIKKLFTFGVSLTIELIKWKKFF